MQGSTPMSTAPGQAMLPRERCEFSAIVDRAPLKLPDAARVAFWTIVNYDTGYRPPDAAAGIARANRRFAPSRRAALELARIWNARGGVAFL